MGAVSLTGNDTVIIDSRIFNNLANGDTAVLDYPNDIAAGAVGKNGNILIAFNATGKTVTLSLRVLLGSSDDKYLNGRYAQYINDPAAFSLLNGEFIKRVGPGDGSAVNVIYKMGQGFFTKPPIAKENVEGDVEQSVAVWLITFPNTDRSIT